MSIVKDADHVRRIINIRLKAMEQQSDSKIRFNMGTDILEYIDNNSVFLNQDEIEAYKRRVDALS